MSPRRPAGRMKVPRVRLKAAGYQLSSPSSVTSKLRPMMPNGAMVWASPAKERNWAMHITKMKSASRAGERPVSGVSAAASGVWPSECFAVGDSVDLRLGALRDPDSFSGIEAMVGSCEGRCPGWNDGMGSWCGVTLSDRLRGEGV